MSSFHQLLHSFPVWHFLAASLFFAFVFMSVHKYTCKYMHVHVRMYNAGFTIVCVYVCICVFVCMCENCE